MTQAEYDELTPAETRERLDALGQLLRAEAEEQVEHTKFLAEVLVMVAGRRV